MRRRIRLHFGFLATAVLLASCDGQGPAASCTDPADLRAVVATHEGLERAQAEIVRLGMGGSPYVAAKIGPLPDARDSPEERRAVETLRRTLEEFKDALVRCRDKRPRAPP